MENRCIQDTKQCGKRHFFGKRGVFLVERGLWRAGERQKEKRPIHSDAVAIFCGI